MIPKEAFCAPEMLTDDVKIIESCISLKTDTTCVAPCKWRQGTGAATQPGAPVYPVNPPVVAPVTPGTPTMPSHVCMPNDMTKMRDAAAMKQCASHTTSSDCVAPDCAFVDTSVIAKMSDDKAELCRPKVLYGAAADVKAAIEAGTITEANAASMIPTLTQINMCLSTDNKDRCNSIPECHYGVMPVKDGSNTDPTKQPPVTGTCTPLSTTLDSASKEKCSYATYATVCDKTKCEWREFNTDVKPVAPVLPVAPVNPPQQDGWC